MIVSERARIGGTLVWYWSLCRREVWLMARGIEPNRKDENLVLGRLIDSSSYAREERRQIRFGDSQFDFIEEKEGQMVIAEIKKSSRTLKASRLQLAHYLYSLKKAGTEARGVLLFPKEKKRMELELTPALMEELDALYRDIDELTSLASPPPLARCRYCAKCAYGDYCWG